MIGNEEWKGMRIRCSRSAAQMVAYLGAAAVGIAVIFGVVLVIQKCLGVP